MSIFEQEILDILKSQGEDADQESLNNNITNSEDKQVEDGEIPEDKQVEDDEIPEDIQNMISRIANDAISKKYDYYTEKSKQNINLKQELNKLNGTVSTKKLQYYINSGIVHEDALSIYVNNISKEIINFNESKQYDTKQDSILQAIRLGNIAYLTHAGIANDTVNINSMLDTFSKGRLLDDVRISTNNHASFSILKQYDRTKEYDKYNWQQVEKWTAGWQTKKEKLRDAVVIDENFESQDAANALNEKDYEELKRYVQMFAEPSINMPVTAESFSTTKNRRTFGPTIKEARMGQEIYNVDKVIEMPSNCNYLAKNKLLNKCFDTIRGYDHNCKAIWKPILDYIAKHFKGRTSLVKEFSILGDTIVVNGMPIAINNELHEYLYGEIGLSLAKTANFKLIFSKFPYIERLHLDQEAWQQLKYEVADKDKTNISDEKKIWRNFMQPNRKLRQIVISNSGKDLVLDRSQFGDCVNSDAYKQMKATNKAEQDFAAACGLLNPNLHSRTIGDKMNVFKALSAGSFDVVTKAQGAWGRSFDLLVADQSISFRRAIGIGLLSAIGTSIALTFGTVFGFIGGIGSLFSKN